MYLVFNKCVTAVKVSNFSGHYLRNRSTLDIGVSGCIPISVYFTIRNTLPNSGTFLLGHPVYTDPTKHICVRSKNTKQDRGLFQAHFHDQIIALHLSLSTVRPINSTSPQPTSSRSIHLCLDLPSGLFPLAFLSITHTRSCYMSLPPHPP
jgi:hypothetical protein